MQNTWQYQGRQEHGEFGHGTAPHTENSATRQIGRENPLVPADIARRALYVAYGVVGHLPFASARFYERKLANGMLGNFQTVVAAHPALAHLSDDAYRGRVLDDTLSPRQTRDLRLAADLTHSARTLDDLAPAIDAAASLVSSAGLPQTGTALAVGAARLNALVSQDIGGLTGRAASHLKGRELAAAGDLPCQGIQGGCASGGSWGTTAMYNVYGRSLCESCAVKSLGLEDEPASERIRSLQRFLLQGR